MDPTYQMVGTDGQTYGPVTLAELNTWIQQGRVSEETSVSRSDHPGWFPASQFAELNFGGTAVATAPAPAPRAFPTATPVVSVPSAEAEELLKRVKSGASWFYWIGALSLINSVVALTGSEWGFILGLGVTQILDVIGQSFGAAGKGIVFALNLVVIGIFVGFGIFANKKHTWAFIVGMVLYALDGAIYVFGSAWLSVGFHAFALFCIFAGLKANMELKKLQS